MTDSERAPPMAITAALDYTNYHLSKVVLLVVLAPEDCGDTKAFLPTLAAVQKAFGDRLVISRYKGSHLERDNPEKTPPSTKEALDYFAYNLQPGDGGGKGHFPSGAIYKSGKEVYRLPSDSQLASISPKTLADMISNCTALPYDLKKLTPPQDRKR